MGNILNKISQNRLQILSGATILSIVTFFIYQHNQKKKFAQTIKKQLNDSSNLENNFNIQFLNQLHKFYAEKNIQSNFLKQKQINFDQLPLKKNLSSIKENNEFPIYKIAITGGPCGGKSTSLERIKKLMTEKGYRVFTVPEIPTMVVLAGGMILMSKFNPQERMKFQSLLMRFQIYAQDYFTRLAQMSKSPCIILCDRGVVDPYAYIKKQQFQAIMDQEGWSWVTLRDKRYDSVIFLSTAAFGAEQFYTLQNNVARSEGIQVARALDKKTLQGWTGHPHLTIVPNTSGQTFKQKIDKTIAAVQKTVGLQNVDFSSKKLLIKQPIFPQDLQVEHTTIEQGFLIYEDPIYSEIKIKKRGQNNSFTYQKKYRTFLNQNGDYSKQIRQPLTSLQYVMLKQNNLDKNFKMIKRKRIHFNFNNIPYAIDVFDQINGQNNVHILRYGYNVNKNQEIQLNLIPNFIDVIKDVKKDKTYSLKEICKVKNK